MSSRCHWGTSSLLSNFTTMIFCRARFSLRAHSLRLPLSPQILVALSRRPSKIVVKASCPRLEIFIPLEVVTLGLVSLAYLDSFVEPLKLFLVSELEITLSTTFFNLLFFRRLLCALLLIAALGSLCCPLKHPFRLPYSKCAENHELCFSETHSRVRLARACQLNPNGLGEALALLRFGGWK